jgi:hypothetical protein
MLLDIWVGQTQVHTHECKLHTQALLATSQNIGHAEHLAYLTVLV